MRTFFFGIISAIVVYPLFGTASVVAHEAGLAKRHFGRPRVPRGTHENIVMRNETTHLTKRFENTAFSFYDAGLGACGKVNSNSDDIVAINLDQWDGGSHCFDAITVTYNGKSIQAQIVDSCEKCPYGGLDFSRGLFYKYSTEDIGVIYGSWIYGSGASEEPQTTKETPKSSSTQPPTSSSEVQTSTTTRTSHTPTSSSTTISTSKTRVSSSSVAPTSLSDSQASSSTWTSKNAVPTASETSTPSSSPEILGQFNQALFQLAELISSGASSG
ncbi:hypothetical protein BDQ17DRAFT_1348006 [Cyathus striatus]|nr:hypothetical protein BDQ17DRAFT_1348006 [Cyathus striatus]